MSRELTDLRDERTNRGSCAGRSGAPRALYGLVAYKRPSVIRAPLVSEPMTSVRWCGGRWPRPSALFEVTSAGGLHEEDAGAGRS
jgi:hypothetical protein